MIQPKPLLTRKDIARLLGSNARQVRLNEKRWGLDKARKDMNSRCVRYQTEIALKILQAQFGLSY